MSMKPVLFRAVLVFMAFVSLSSYCEDVQVEGYPYRLDIPENWVLLDASNLAYISFTDPSHSVVLQVASYPGETFFKAQDMFETVKKQMNAEGEGENFIFSMKNSYFSELTFQTGSFIARGYFIFINGKDYDYGVFCFAPKDLFETFHAFILSALDSFSLDEEGIFYPGPVSQYYYPFPGPRKEKAEVKFLDTSLSLGIDANEVEASQLVIEREALVLAAYETNRIKAWERFYRMIYRDSYHRLDDLFDLLVVECEKKGKNKKEMISLFLTWIQNFSYEESNSIGDIISPLTSAVLGIGDCDSRSLLYVILLHHLGADAVLFVSAVYSHSGAGVDNGILGGTGARIEAFGKEYLYAELTAKVAIGMIAKDMADPAGWIPIHPAIRE
ncbi:MAG: hypothetical protein JW881_09300 [Spirochaetales bacterium]|nr:hypothetical protein [Spirochaetales bacterium]